jgi:hypothetical protein
MSATVTIVHLPRMLASIFYHDVSAARLIIWWELAAVNFGSVPYHDEGRRQVLAGRKSATVEEMAALNDEANEAARLVLRCWLASDPASHFSPEEAAMLRAELVRLGEALKAQIAEIIDIRLAQRTGGTASSTRH